MFFKLLVKISSVILILIAVLLITKTGNITGFFVLEISNQTEFDKGMYNKTFLNSSGFIQLNNSFSGDYVSQVFNAMSSASWESISWGGELPELTKLIVLNPTLAVSISEADITSFVNVSDGSDTWERVEVRSWNETIPQNSTINSVIAYCEAEWKDGGTVKLGFQISTDGGTNWSGEACVQTVTTQTTFNCDLQSNFGVNTSDNLNNLRMRCTFNTTKIYSTDWVHVKVNYTSKPAELKFQARSDDDNSSWPAFSGPDGSPDTYYTNSSFEEINITNNPYFQFKAFFNTQNLAYSAKLYNVTIIYNILNAAPYIPALNSPANNSNIATNYSLLNTTVSDPNGDNMDVYFLGNGMLINTTLNAANNSYVIYNWTGLSDGTYNWSVIASDGAINTSSTTRYFNIDTTPITATITNPQNTTYTTSQTALNFTLSEPAESCWYSLNYQANTTIPCSNGTIITAQEGLNVLILYVNDSLQNTASATVNFSVDTKAPLFSNNQAVNTTIANIGTTIKLNQTITDETSGVDSAKFNISGAYYYALKNLDQYYYFLQCEQTEQKTWQGSWANDTLNNINTTTFQNNITFNCDGEKPQITACQSDKSLIGLNENATLTCTVTDTGGGSVDTVIYTIEDANQTALNTTTTYYYNYTCASSNAQVNFSYAWSNDTAGNSNSTNLNIIIECDADPPLITSTSVNSTTVNQGDFICVNATITETNLDNAWVQLTKPNGEVENITLLDSSSCSNGGGDSVFGAEKQLILGGNYTINTTFANDTLAQTGYQTPHPNIIITSISSDTTLPNISNCTTNATVIKNNETSRLRCDITDNILIINAWFTLNNSIKTASLLSNNTYYYDFACTTSQNTVWERAYAEDSSLNINYTIVNTTIICDSKAPNVENLTITPQGVKAGDGTILTCDARDAENNLETVWYIINETGETGLMSLLAQNTYFLNYTAPNTGGTYTFTCYANDSFGQQNLSSKQFIIGEKGKACLEIEQRAGVQYYPGEEIITSIILKDAAGELVQNADINIDVINPDSLVFKQLNANKTSAKSYDARFELESNASYGTYQLIASVIYGDCVAYDNSVFVVRQFTSPKISVSSEENYNRNEKAVISSAITNSKGTLSNPQWINITIMHADSQTIIVNNTQMNPSGIDGFFSYVWSAPDDAACGGYEAIVRSMIDNTIVGDSSTFSVSCWASPRLGISTNSPANNTLIGYHSTFKNNITITANDVQLKDCVGRISFYPITGLTLPNNDEEHSLGDVPYSYDRSDYWTIKADKAGSYNITARSVCSQSISGSSTVYNITVREEPAFSLIKYFEPQTVISGVEEPVNITILLKNNGTDTLKALQIIDEIPFDFSNPNSVSAWFVNDSTDFEIITGYEVNISNIDSDSNIEILYNIADLNQTNIGHYLNKGDSIKLNYTVNSSSMGVNETRNTNTTTVATDLFNGLGTASIAESISSLPIIIRASKDVRANNEADPSNATDEIRIKAIGGLISELSFSDYLPEGANATNTTIVYHNNTSETDTELQKDADYTVTTTYGTLPDGSSALILNYNLSITSPTNWDNNLYDGDSIVANSSIIIIGGGSWSLPATIFGFDPVYQQFIRTEVYDDYSVPLFDILLNLITKIIKPGQETKATLTLMNIGGPKALADVFLMYSIKTMAGELIVEKSETIAVLEEKTKDLILKAPEKLKQGYYTFEALITYTGREAMATDMFEVVETRNKTYGIISLLIIVFMIVMFPQIKKRIKTNTRIPRKNTKKKIHRKKSRKKP